MPSSGRAQNQTPQLDDIEYAKVIEVDRQLRIYRARQYAKDKNILMWGKMLFPDKFYLPFCWELHGYFVSIRDESFTNTEAPRNHAKTLIKCFLIPLFQALEEPGLFQHYLNVQATRTKALSINMSIRSEIESNQELREIYGDQIGNEKWTDQQFVLKNKTIFTAVSAGESIRGLNYRNIRPDYQIVDDLYDEEDINNPESTERKNAWFWGSLYPARAKSRRCSMHVQGTAINNEDLLEKLKTQSDVKSATYKAIKDFDRKEVLWIELNTYESLNLDMAKMGSIIFMREMQNERRNESVSIVKRSWLQDWEYDPIELRKDLAAGTRHILHAVIIGNDPSVGKDEEADDTGICLALKTGWVDAQGTHEWWIERIDGQKLSMLARIAQLQEYADAQPPTERVTDVRIEAIGAFDDYAQEAARKTNLPVTRVAHVTNKLTNLINKSRFFEQRRIHINRNIPSSQKEKLIEQLTTNVPKMDDMRDCVLLLLDETSGLWSFV